MKARHIVAALTFLTSTLAHAAVVSSVTARGHTIYVGDTADSVFKVLKEKDMVNQDVEKTEDGLRVTKRYRVQDKAFVLVFVRSRQGATSSPASMTEARPRRAPLVRPRTS